MKKLTKILIGLGLVANSVLNAKNIDKNIEKEFIQSIIPNTKFNKYEKSVVDGFYTIYLKNGQIIYVNPFKKLIFFGQIFTNTGFSITQNEIQKYQEELNKKLSKTINVNELKENSFKISFNKGSKDYEFIIFTDPECPYCKRLENYLSDYNIDVFINFYPLPFHKKAKPLSLKILSSKNPTKTFKAFKKGEDISDIKITKEAKKRLENMVKLAKKLGIKGTPMVYVVDKKTNKVIDLIKGANLLKVKKYLE